MSPTVRMAALMLVLLASGCREALVRPAPRDSAPVAPLATFEPEPAAATPAPPVHPTDQQLLALPDATPRAEARARLGNPAFYEVYGQRYTVLADGHGYLERGVASWYGPDFHGEHTSTGESYDMYSMTAAHRTLPLPSYARVTNLKNGRSVVVRVNDRGPFKSNRIIDMSYAAALKLDMIRDGTTLVEVTALDPEGASAPPPKPSELYMQAGAFGQKANGAHLHDLLSAQGIRNVLLVADPSRDPPLYRVRIGPIASVADYDALLVRLKALGVANPTLVTN